MYYLSNSNLDRTCDSCALSKISDSFFEECNLSTHRGHEVNKVNINNSTVNEVHQTTDNDVEDIHSTHWFQTNIRSYYKSNLIIGHLNINSIYNKLDEVKYLLNKNMFDILFLAEAKIDRTVSDALLNHHGYRLIRQDRKKGTGGIMAYIRSDLPVYRKRKLEPENVESICLEVKDSNNSRFLVCACSRSPGKCKETDFISSLTNAAEMMYRTRKELMLIGDFNMNMSESTRMVSQIRIYLTFVYEIKLHSPLVQLTNQVH